MTDENEFSAAAGKAVDDALAAIETIGKAGDNFRAAVEERFGAEVARRGQQIRLDPERRPRTQEGWVAHCPPSVINSRRKYRGFPCGLEARFWRAASFA